MGWKKEKTKATTKDGAEEATEAKDTSTNHAGSCKSRGQEWESLAERADETNEDNKEVVWEHQETPEEKQNKKRKKQLKPTYVPSPIGALIDQARTMGLHLVTNQQNELEFQREGRSAIPLTKWGNKSWTKEVKKQINDDLLKELHEAVKPDFDKEGNPLMPRRKDMVGFPEMVDRHATMALLKRQSSNHIKETTKKAMC